MTTTNTSTPGKVFSGYDAFIIAILALLQFTIVLDFMVLSPLGAILMKEMHITTTQFGYVVSAYAFSAGASGLLAAGFADKFDRKKLLLFFYGGFMLGTLCCAIAPNFHFLLIARVITGIFGGVIGSVSMAIITDLFRMEVRGRVMGFVQMSFSASQILGLPIGLILADHFGWHAPFSMIVGFGVVLGLVIMIYMKPIAGHLAIKQEKNAFHHLASTLTEPSYLMAFLATTLIATGGYMLMPFASTFAINNLGLKWDQLSILYGMTGLAALLFGPLTGKLSDRIGKYPVFCIGTGAAILMLAIYGNLGITPLSIVVAINMVMFVAVTARVIASSALMTAIPRPQDRGAFMSINSAVQQISGGIGSVVAGFIVFQDATGKLVHYDTLCYVVIGAMLVMLVLMYQVNQIASRKQQEDAQQAQKSVLA
ncbi:MFS transporter [Chitinophaga pendula]|uniref:MFS transporter n=1 Tax=Chitinophaga TaxID=79328 RepID=UPI000BB07E02|nr:MULTISPECIES: MFS transporter [Chitinophaga]ASZ09813.1 MFS transporter [Chitinophaga sp. MD30]UCJ07247.1 MFS transporter [Chitinophaga pendula]